MSKSSKPENDSVAKLREKAEVEPVKTFLDSKILELSSGYAKVSMKMKPEYLNFNGMVFGGIVMALADCAFALATNAATFPSLASQFNIYFLSRVEPTDELFAECNMIKNGRRAGISEITITNQTGELIAKATGITIPVKT